MLNFYENGKGKSICYIHDSNIEKGNYIIRNTHEFNQPSQPFDIVALNNCEGFNCGFVEKYDETYFKMRHHSDCSLDIDEKSNIGIIAFYESDVSERRAIEFKSKIDGTLNYHILEHNSMILISFSKNQECTHSITGKARVTIITLYKSKTFILEPFRKATLSERKEFYNYRSQENKNINFKYPEINYKL